MTQPRPLPWQDRAAVTRREAAAIFDKPARWIDHQVDAGRLLSYQSRPNGPRMICVQSMLDFLAGGEQPPSSPLRPAGPFCRPRLVWRHPTL
jgi:hypothetical protein